jgi:hypothetical protein
LYNVIKSSSPSDYWHLSQLKELIKGGSLARVSLQSLKMCQPFVWLQ